MAMPVVLPGKTVGPASPEMSVRTTLEDVSVAMVALGLPTSMMMAVDCQTRSDVFSQDDRELTLDRRSAALCRDSAASDEQNCGYVANKHDEGCV